MIISALEMITQATSNFHFIFCFCNVIIIFLLIDRSKSDSNPIPSNADEFLIVLSSNSTGIDYRNHVNEVKDDRIQKESSSEIIKHYECDKEDSADKNAAIENQNDSELRKGNEQFTEKEPIEVEFIEIESIERELIEEEFIDEENIGKESIDKVFIEEEQEEKEVDDHELKIRIEDFISKIHREWQAERLKVCR
ncbi:unnamed protein product [Amaranthus hypochondriacus]